MVRSQQAGLSYQVLVMAALCLCLPWCFTLRGQTVQESEAVIAKAGATLVTEREFLQRLELLPPMSARSRADRGYAKYEVLYSLIAEKVLAQEAVRRGLHRSESFAESMTELRKLYARDALYRDEVRNRVSLSDQEIVEGIAMALTEVKIEYLYFDRREDADFVSGQLDSSRSVIIDSTFNAIRDTATVIFGDAEAPVEDAAYRLRPGQWSPVVSAGMGYYLLQARSRRSSAYYSGLPAQDLRDQVSTLLRRRKEQARAKEFVQEVLKGRIGYGIRPSIAVLAEAVLRTSEAQAEDEPFFTGRLLASVLKDLGKAATDTIAVAGERFWTTAEFAERLTQRSFGLAKGDRAALAGSFNEELQLMVRQELLAQEGIRRKLDQRPDIAAQIRMWYDQNLAAMMKQAIGRSVKVSSGEAWAHLASLDTMVTVPRVRIRELVTSSMTSLSSAVDDLERGEEFESVIRRWSDAKSARTTNGVTEPFPITDRQPIGEIAWGMTAGERFGPVRQDTAYVIFELVSKEQTVIPSDTGGNFQTAISEVHQMKAKRATNVFIARLAQELGFEIYSERVQTVQASGIPMMTYRFLGFGGRMFAVPLVDRQIEYLNADPGGETLP